MSRRARLRRRSRRDAAKASAHTAGEVGRINVTPLIDVVMCLIIFYLIVGSLVLERRGDVPLPPSRTGVPEEPTDRPIIVAVRAGGEILIDGLPVEPDRLTSALSARVERSPTFLRVPTPIRPVQVRADRALPYEQIRPVLDACRDAGVATVQLAASEAR